MYSSEKKALIGGIVMITIVLAILFSRYYYDQREEQKSQEETLAQQENENVIESDFPTISSHELEALLKEDDSELRIIDIRPQRSYEIKHLPDTANIPRDRLTLRDVFLPAEQIIVLIDENGISHTNEQVFQEITDAGQKKRVVLLEGGFDAWDTQTGRTISYGDPTSFIDHAKVSPISKTSLQENLAQDPDLYTLLDVRTEKSFKKEHIDGAINIPLLTLEEKASTLPIGRIFIVYGEDELEGFQAAVRLHDIGHLAVQMLQGGYKNWITPHEETPSNDSSETTDKEPLQ